MSPHTMVTCSLIVVAVLPVQALETDDVTAASEWANQLQADGNSATASAAFVKLRTMLSSAPDEAVNTIQAQLCAALWVSIDPGAIRRMALVLSAAPCDEAIVVLALRLDRDIPRAIGLALCDGIHAFTDRRPSLSPATSNLALERLEALARHAQTPGAVVDAAIMAHATFGADGFDQLMNLELDPTAPNKVHSVLLVALAETDDPRALAVLRDTAASPAKPESRRLQALYGLRQMFSRTATRGWPVDAASQLACADAVRGCLRETTSDRVFPAALKALAQLAVMEQDEELEQATLTALASDNDARREAAAEVLFQQNVLLKAYILDQLRQAAALDRNPDVRSTAAAVLEKQMTLQPTVPPVGAE